MKRFVFVCTLLAIHLLEQVNALSTSQFPTRAEVLKSSVCATLGLIVPVWCARADDEEEDLPETSERQQQGSISDVKLKSIITSDVVDRQFLATADLTREIYDYPTATFTDEIDTYTMDKWIEGTKKLFVGENSRVRLVGEVNVSPQQADFRFDEDLQFRVPFHPTVHLTGKVVLTRDATSGLITSYQEFWDQSVVDVLKTAKF